MSLRFITRSATQRDLELFAIDEKSGYNSVGTTIENSLRTVSLLAIFYSFSWEQGTNRLGRQWVSAVAATLRVPISAPEEPCVGTNATLFAPI